MEEEEEEKEGPSTRFQSGREATGGKGRYHRNRSSHLALELGSSHCS